MAGLGLTLAGAVLARTALSATSHLRVTGRQASRHARTARMVGHPGPSLGAVLVDHPQPAAYRVAGRHPTVVLTTGTVAALDPGQLTAVLAHERAHLAGHHHRLLAMARIGRQVLPFLPLMRDADAQVARLVEMHADDAAQRASGARPLATALVVLATAASPASALAAGATDTVHRIQRLLDPAQPLSAVRRRLLRTAAAAFALTPVLLALAPAVLALALGRVPARRVNRTSLLSMLVDSRDNLEFTMRHPRIIIAAAGLAAAVATAGGITAASAGGPPASSPPSASPAAAAATVRTAPVTVAGRTETILVSTHGLPLYYYQPDTAARSLVTGTLARLWPPLTSAAPTATGATGQLTVLNDIHGHQVSYNGHPLYTFASDHPGQVTGQGIQNFYVATPALTPLTSTSRPSTTPASNTPGY